MSAAGEAAGAAAVREAVQAAVNEAVLTAQLRGFGAAAVTLERVRDELLEGDPSVPADYRRAWDDAIGCLRHAALGLAEDVASGEGPPGA